MPETATHAQGESSAQVAALLRNLNVSLHDLSQPLTVLLCTLEYGAGLESLSEMKEAIEISQEACERLRRTVVAMQLQVRQGIETDAGGGAEGPGGDD